jgi:two-component system response regulator (stage 0 sporulation protein F)
MSGKQTILYVDDEPINLQLFVLHTQTYFNILTAESGMVALDVLEQNPQISVIFSDMKMPGINGLQFIGLAKEKRPDIFYFIITGFDITSEIADAINNKMIVNYFRKPYKPKLILETINDCLNIT